MRIEDNELAQEIIEILIEEGWEPIISEYEFISFKQLGADPDSDHIIRISEYDEFDNILIEELEDGEEPPDSGLVYPQENEIEEVEEFIKAASGGIYYA